MARTVSNELRKWRNQGWYAEKTNGGHIRLRHPDVSQVVHIASTPSDHRAMKNIDALLKRTLRNCAGVDVAKQIDTAGDKIPRSIPKLPDANNADAKPHRITEILDPEPVHVHVHVHVRNPAILHPSGRLISKRELRRIKDDVNISNCIRCGYLIDIERSRRGEWMCVDCA